MWPIQSWAILLAASLDSLSLLIVLRNLADGVDSSIFFIFLPLVDCGHSVFHLLRRSSLSILLAAAGLVRSGFLRYSGSVLASDVKVLRPLMYDLYKMLRRVLEGDEGVFMIIKTTEWQTR